MLAEYRMVTTGYFDVFNIPFHQGRRLSPQLDVSANKAPTVVVNDAFVRKFLPSGFGPATPHLDDHQKPEEKTAVVGVMGNVSQDIREPGLAEMDYLLDEIPAKDRPAALSTMVLVMRTDGDPKQIVSALRNALHEIDPTVPLADPRTMTEVIAETLVFERMESWLFGIFAGLALALALVGLYGLISHEVEQSTRDIGVRMALGASRPGILAMVLRRVAWMLGTGTIAGLVLTLLARKLIGVVIYFEPQKEAGGFLLVALPLVVAGLVAALIPARRAASIEPMQALRAEYNQQSRRRNDEHAASGHSLRTAPVAQVAGIHADRGRHAGAGHRRQRRCLHALRSGAAAHVARRAAQGVGAFRVERRLLRFDRAASAATPRTTSPIPCTRICATRTRFFPGCSLRISTGVGVSWRNQAENKDAEVVTGNYFQLLGLKPAVGRLLTPQDDTAKNANPVAVLSYDYWKTRFAASRDVVGQTVLINGHPFTILGVAPENFDSAIGGYKPGLFIPISMVEIAMPWMAPRDNLNRHDSVWLTLVARLKPGVSNSQAEASLGPLWHSLRAYELTLYKSRSERFKKNFLDNSHLKVLDDSTGFSPDRMELKTPLIILMSMAGLLIAMCAINVATLLLLRAAGRAREMSMRYALGAQRSRIVSQLLVEGGLLGIAGAAAGLALAPLVATYSGAPDDQRRSRRVSRIPLPSMRACCCSRLRFRWW